jgi:hypothetical protein
LLDRPAIPPRPDQENESFLVPSLPAIPFHGPDDETDGHPVR